MAFRAQSLTVTRAVEQQTERIYELARSGKKNVPVTGLTISPATTNLHVGSSRTLVPTVAPTTASVKTVTWSSSNSAVASVDASTGKVTAVGTGTATITGTTLSSNKTATATVTVNGGSETGQAATGANVVNQAPTLTMDVYQQTIASGDTRGTDVVVTWGSGATELTGTVALQYYDDGAWKTKQNITVTNGRGTERIYLKSSRAWRVQALSVNNATIGEAAKYSNGYAYNVVRTRASTSTPRIYAPTMVAMADQIPIVASWDNPSGGYPTNMRLQYKSGSKWKTKMSFSINGGTQKLISTTASSSKRWRIVTSSSSRPKGAKTLVSSSVYVQKLG